MAVTRVVLGLLSLVPGIFSLRVTAGSPCADVCQDPTNTTSSEIVCSDQQYNTTTTGSEFQNCISCELQSTYGNPSTGETDVNWGLYNLRYAFSSCVYDFPLTVTNVSTPCLVSCTPLAPALEFQLVNPSLSTMSTFCGSSAFADNVVSTCEACYALTLQQSYLANFLEAIRYNCHFQTLVANAFAIAPSRIFNGTQLPTTTAAYTTSSTAKSSSALHKNLTLIIVFPIVAFVIFLFLMSLCCFCLVRHRRKKAKERNYSQHLHARWNDTTISTPAPGAWGNFSPYHSPLPHQMMPSAGGYYGSGGLDVVDPDGSRYDGSRYDAGFAKSGFSSYESSVSPLVTMPPQAFHFNEPEKPLVQGQPHFPPPTSQQER